MKLYDVLGAKKGDPISEIKKKFRKLASKFHPDKEGGDKGKYQIIQHAYDILGDKEKRKRYDETGCDDSASNREPTIEEKAEMAVMEIFRQQLNNHNYAHVNYIKKVKTHIKQAVSETHNRKFEKEHKIKNIDKLISKIKGPIFINSLESSKSSLEHEINKLKESHKVFEIALKIVNGDYEWLDEDEGIDEFKEELMSQIADSMKSQRSWNPFK